MINVMGTGIMLRAVDSVSWAERPKLSDPVHENAELQ